jgi:hypothetical protein
MRERDTGNMAYEKAFFHKELGEFITPRVVLAWPNVMTARRIKGDSTSDPRFTVTGLIPKGADVSVMLEEYNRAGKAEHGAMWGKKKTLQLAFNTTADDPALEAFADEYPPSSKGQQGPRRSLSYMGPTSSPGVAKPLKSTAADARC